MKNSLLFIGVAIGIVAVLTISEPHLQSLVIIDGRILPVSKRSSTGLNPGLKPADLPETALFNQAKGPPNGVLATALWSGKTDTLTTDVAIDDNDIPNYLLITSGKEKNKNCRLK